MPLRCDWGKTPEIMLAYHDTEWGVPLYDDRKLFEFLVLESMQAGLSWLTVLNKRENFRKAFDRFDPEKIVRYDKKKVRQLLNDAGIIRNRLKIEAVIANAGVFLEIKESLGSFHQYVWDFVGGSPIVNKRRHMKDLPATTPESDAMSKALREHGFKFVGSTVCYAHMQATGMVNDHAVSCFRYREVIRLAKPLAKANSR